MTDLDPLLPDDELVSAVLDGEATPDEVARVDADPRLRARLEELRQLAARVAAPPPSGAAAAARDDLIASALALAAGDGTSRADDPGTEPRGEVVDLATRRRVPPSWVLGVAAAIAFLVLLAVPLALRDDDAAQDTAAAPTTAVDATAGADRAADDQAAATPEAAEAADDPSTNAGADDDLAGEADAADDGASLAEGDALPAPSLAPEALPTTGSVLVVESLGAYASSAEASAAVTAAVDAALAAERAESPPATGAPESGADDVTDGISEAAVDDPLLQACVDDVRTRDDELVGLVWVGTVDLPDGAHHLLLFRLTDTGAENGTHRLYEVASPACSVVGRTTVS